MSTTKNCPFGEVVTFVRYSKLDFILGKHHADYNTICITKGKVCFTALHSMHNSEWEANAAPFLLLRKCYAINLPIKRVWGMQLITSGNTSLSAVTAPVPERPDSSSMTPGVAAACVLHLQHSTQTDTRTLCSPRCRPAHFEVVAGRAQLQELINDCSNI